MRCPRKRAAKWLVCLLTVGMLLPAGEANTRAQTAPTYLYGAQIANLEATQAQVQVTIYDNNDQVLSSTVDLIPANSSRTYFPLNQVTNGVCGAGLQSAVAPDIVITTRFLFPGPHCYTVIESSNRLAALVNLVKEDFSAGAAYLYDSAGALSVFLPLLSKSCNHRTWFSLVNLSSSTADVQISYSDGTSASAAIPPNRAQIFDQLEENHVQRVFAGTLTSNQPVFAAVVQETGNFFVAEAGLLEAGDLACQQTVAGQVTFAYTGFTGSSTSLVFPLINFNSAGYITGLQIQNTGNQASEVTVSYSPIIGTPCTETQTIQAQASATYALAAFHATAPLPAGGTSNCVKGARFIGSASVSGNSTNQPLVGISNQLLPGLTGEAYGAFDPQRATNKVVLPLILDRRGGANKFFTGFNLQNVGTETATVSCTFTDAEYTIPATALEPGAALNDLQYNKLANNYAGSATCMANEANARIVAVVNELGDRASADQLLVYEGIAGQ